MFHAVRVLSITSSLALSAIAAIAADKGERADKSDRPASALPRYRLEVGQQLDYEGEGNYKYDGGEMRSATEWRLLVAAVNQGGGWRILASKTSWHGSGGKEIVKDTKLARPALGYFDLYADGRIVENSSLGFQIDPREIFPRLPDDDRQLAAGWNAQGATQEVHRYQLKSSADGKPRISDKNTSPMHDVYLLSGETTYLFDLSRGIVDRVESTTSQGWGIKGEGTGEIRLTSSEARSAEAVAKLADEMNTYFDAADAYQKLMDQAEKDAGRGNELSAQAKERLQHAASQLTAAMLKTQAEALLSRHDAMAKYAAQQAERFAKVVGKEAAVFETTDLDGQPCSLADYRGKVAVLDFWYRGCGWCIRAMPQINDVARTFKGRPVAVLGMNTDQDIDDAKFVVEKLGLEYPNIKAQGLPERFGVQGFPTLVVIDPKGIVRHVHVGYSPTLAADLTEKIDALLAEKGQLSEAPAQRAD